MARLPIYGPGNRQGIALMKRSIKARGKFKKNSRVITIAKALGPVPQAVTCTMKYSESFTITNTLGVYASYTYNLNSIYDPNRSGTGHQPYGHDTYQTLYTKYLVTRVKWLITAAPTTAISVKCGIAAVNSVNDPGFPTISEVPHSQTKLLGADLKPVIFMGSTNLAKLSSYPSKYNNDDLYAGTYGASPSELMALIIGTNNADGSTVSTNFYITMWFTVKSYDPKELAGS